MTTCWTSLGGDVGPLQRGLDRGPAELGGVYRGEPSAELADRRAGGREDDCLGHRGWRPSKVAGGGVRWSRTVMVRADGRRDDHDPGALDRRRHVVGRYSTASRSTSLDAPGSRSSALLDPARPRPTSSHLALTHVDGRRVIAGRPRRPRRARRRAGSGRGRARAHRRARELGARRCAGSCRRAPPTRSPRASCRARCSAPTALTATSRGGDGAGEDAGGSGIERLLVSRHPTSRAACPRGDRRRRPEPRPRARQPAAQRPDPDRARRLRRELAAARPALTVTVLDGEEMRRLGWARSPRSPQGSDEDPAKLIALSYDRCARTASGGLR